MPPEITRRTGWPVFGCRRSGGSSNDCFTSKRSTLASDPSGTVSYKYVGIRVKDNHESTPLAVHVALALAAVLFGATYVAGKIAMREITPAALVLLRAWGTAIILFCVLGARRTGASVRLSKRDLGLALLYSFLGVSINQICFLNGLMRSTATDASIMQVLIPLFTLGFAVLLRRERLTGRLVLGLALGLCGGLLLIVPRGGLDFSSRTAAGNLFLLASGLCYALYLVLTRDLLARREPLVVVSWVFLAGALVITPFGLGPETRFLSRGASGAGWASIIFVVIGGTTLPYLLNNWALVRVRSSVVGVYVFLQPFVGILLGNLILGERLGSNSALAGALVISGVIVSTQRRS